MRRVGLGLVVVGFALGCSSVSHTGDGTGGSAGNDSGGTGASGGNGAQGGSAGSAGVGASGGAGGTAGSAGAGAGGGSGGVWSPGPGTSWQWQLTGTLDTSVDVAMYDIDLFDVDQATVQSLQAAGRVVICYFSAGSREDWRSDAGQFQAADYENPLDDWPGETWLDVRSSNVRNIMKARLDLAVSKGCDGVEPDNVDGYSNATGFPLTESDQVDYNRFLASEAHGRGLSVGLKNALDLVPQLVTHFDWALNEECLSYDECSALAPFISAGKAVFHVEYVDSQSEGSARLGAVCGDSTTTGFSTLVKMWDLDAWRLACP
ncbi:MAG: endo alpha-1,4 polygalactosaminidase [Polyangiaceae bacterium]